jgi:hypothetical protein
MANELICPTCHVALDEQQLLAQTWSVEACPNCRSVVRRTESFQWRDQDALNKEDISSINQWLAAVQREFAPGMQITVDRQQSRIRWEIVELPGNRELRQWTTAIEYDPHLPGILDLRATSNQQVTTFLDDLSILDAACAEQGVQPHGSKRQEWTIWGGQRFELNWGAEQTLRIGQRLSAPLFLVVIERLRTAMCNALIRTDGYQNAIEPKRNGIAEADGLGLTTEAVKCYKA